MLSKATTRIPATIIDGASSGIGAALRGSESAPAYVASNVFMSNYLEGLHGRFRKTGLPIAVTDVRPGSVQTEMAKADVTAWMASPAKAACRRVVYVTRRWGGIAWLLLLPARVWARLG
jgi:short-subunit dehydrogenase